MLCVDVTEINADFLSLCLRSNLKLSKLYKSLSDIRVSLYSVMLHIQIEHMTQNINKKFTYAKNNRKQIIATDPFFRSVSKLLRCLSNIPCPKDESTKQTSLSSVFCQGQTSAKKWFSHLGCLGGKMNTLTQASDARSQAISCRTSSSSTSFFFIRYGNLFYYLFILLVNIEFILLIISGKNTQNFETSRLLFSTPKVSL